MSTGATRLTLSALPPAARAIAAALADGVAAAGATDGEGFEDAVRRLSAADPEYVRVVLGAVARLLLEELHPDGIGGPDLHDLVRRVAVEASGWLAGVDPGVLVVVLAGALGVHEEAPVRPDEPPPPRPAPESVTRHALLVLADLLTARGRPLRPYLESAFTELARAETTDSP